MKLDKVQVPGVALAVYGDSPETTRLSVSHLEGMKTGIYLQTCRKYIFDATDPDQVQRAMRVMVESLSDLPEGFVRSVRKNPVKVPLIVASGCPTGYENKPLLEALNGLTGDNQVRDSIPGGLLNLTHAKDPTKCQHTSYELFPCGDTNQSAPDAMNNSKAERMLAHLVAKSGHTKREAAAMVQIAIQDADSYFGELARKVSPDNARFCFFGSKKNPEDPRYSYLNEGYGVLKDVFVRQLVSRFTVPHNFCIKTPQDPPAPPFVDICGTLIQDFFDQFKRNVEYRNCVTNLERADVRKIDLRES